MSTPEKMDAVYDARSLGKTKVLILGLQHMFAMFGATVLVPAITGLNVSTTLLCAGLAVAAIVGIVMNAILPGMDYEFGTNEQGDTAVNFGSRHD